MRLALALTALAPLALAGCGGGFSCSERGRCTNSPKPTSTEVSDCEQDVQDSLCGSQAEDLIRCFREQTACDGKGDEDVPSTLDTCQPQVSALESCCARSPDSNSCKGEPQ